MHHFTNTLMIKSFKSRALKAFWEKNDASRLDAKQIDRIRRRLDALHAAGRPEDMNIPGFKLHELKGASKGVYSIWISGPWRITFEWEAPDAINIDIEQYH